jgi:hypothetical protein
MTTAETRAAQLNQAAQLWTRTAPDDRAADVLADLAEYIGETPARAGVGVVALDEIAYAYLAGARDGALRRDTLADLRQASSLARPILDAINR